ncbi:MAG: hypothetical protein J3K34DRAFT_248683 [Monoraphidium minutum]|nr:MAG: hypothetical protein J3K34DRAFT_248683 [Monoraphidium minutum]
MSSLLSSVRGLSVRATRGPAAQGCPAAAWRAPAPRAGRARRAAPPAAADSEGASTSGSAVVYEGVYGPWQVEREDEIEVLCYRLGLSGAAIGLAGGAAAGLAGADGLLDPLCALGITGLGASVFLIHVYVDPLKRFLQVMWASGALGAAYLAFEQCGGQPVARYVAEHPWGVWLVGPYFAALTGIAVKEGLCYGKAEAAGVALLLPLLLLGHLSGLLPPAALRVLLVASAGAVGVFAGRKYTQAVKDDIGDKSIFE